MWSADGPWSWASEPEMHIQTAGGVSMLLIFFLLDGGIISVNRFYKGLTLMPAHMHYMSDF